MTKTHIARLWQYAAGLTKREVPVMHRFNPDPQDKGRCVKCDQSQAVHPEGRA
jgi:hypothetical protein